MITIKIDHKEATQINMVNYLEHIANLVSQGYDHGEDWSISGIDEDEKAGLRDFDLSELSTDLTIEDEI